MSTPRPSLQGSRSAAAGLAHRRVDDAHRLRRRQYRCANDVSARDLQYGDKQWTRGKGFDTFCPLGDRLVPVSELGDGSGLRVRQRLNGQLLQDGDTSDLVFGVRALIRGRPVHARVPPATLHPHFGTPSGIGYARTPPVSMRDGDLVEVEIEGIGVLANPVARRAALSRSAPERRLQGATQLPLSEPEPVESAGDGPLAV